MATPTYAPPVERRSSGLEVRVTGPDCEPIAAGDLRRLFPGAALTEGRLNRLREWPRVTVLCGPRLVAVATCKKTETELRVPEIGLDEDAGCGVHEIVTALLDALEVAGLAGGCRRLVIFPPKGTPSFLERRGYTVIAERCAGGWLEKRLV